MNDIDYVCFALSGTDEIIKEEVEKLKSMLGRKYEVKFSIAEEYNTRLMSIKKLANKK
jgi:hypothetical protein